MARAANVCPRCGASVTPYAAGCGVCGADLERLRRARRRRAPSAPSLATDLAQNLVLAAVMVLVAVFAPLWGLLLAGLVSYDRNRRGERTMRNVAIAAGALALVGFFMPLWPLGQLGPVTR